MACNVPIISVPVGDVEKLLAGFRGCHVSARDAETTGEQSGRTLLTPGCEGRKAIIAKGLDLQSVARQIIAEYNKTAGLSTDPGALEALAGKER